MLLRSPLSLCAALFVGCSGAPPSAPQAAPPPPSVAPPPLAAAPAPTPTAPVPDAPSSAPLAPAPAPPLALEVWATTSGSTNGPFRDGATLRTGDRLFVVARSSVAANVYLVYCARKNVPTLYPTGGGAILFAEGERRSLPAEGKDFRVTGEPGREALYVIAARRSLAESDPALQSALAAGTATCGTGLERTLAGVQHSLPAPPAPVPSVVPRRQVAATHSLFSVRSLEIEDTPDASVRVTAGDDGVVVLRLAFTHER